MIECCDWFLIACLLHIFAQSILSFDNFQWSKGIITFTVFVHFINFFVACKSVCFLTCMCVCVCVIDEKARENTDLISTLGSNNRKTCANQQAKVARKR